MIVNVALGHLHGGQAAGVFARHGLGECPEERNKQVFSYEPPE